MHYRCNILIIRRDILIFAKVFFKLQYVRINFFSSGLTLRRISWTYYKTKRFFAIFDKCRRSCIRVLC